MDATPLAPPEGKSVGSAFAIAPGGDGQLASGLSVGGGAVLVGRGSGAIPYEFLLMLPYVLTILALLVRVRRGDQPAELGRPYIKGAR